MRSVKTNISTVEIAIPALNESANILRLLKSINEQVVDDFVIRKVYVISDGSDDDTVQIAKQYNSLPLEVIEHKKRAGKTVRMNEIFKLSSADILVLFDADVILNSTKTLRELVLPILQHGADLTSGKPEKTNSYTWVDKIMNVSMYLQDEVKLSFHHGDSVYACHGRIVALKRNLYKKLHLPMPSVANDAYLYFFNKIHDGKFTFTPNATVLYKAPQSFNDYVKQQRRFSTTPGEQSKVFGKDILYEYQIPFSLRLKVMVKALFKFNVYTIIYIGFRFISNLKPSSYEGKWDVSQTTKTI